MATKQVVSSECDRCHTEVTEDLSVSGKRNRPSDPFALPKGWLHVSGNTQTTTVFELDLCEVCKVDVLKAAGAAQRLSVVRA
jgi:hypothetical protein